MSSSISAGPPDPRAMREGLSGKCRKSGTEYAAMCLYPTIPVGGVVDASTGDTVTSDSGINLGSMCPFQESAHGMTDFVSGENLSPS
jgi:hypothetical protein